MFFLFSLFHFSGLKKDLNLEFDILFNKIFTSFQGNGTALTFKAFKNRYFEAVYIQNFN